MVNHGDSCTILYKSDISKNRRKIGWRGGKVKRKRKKENGKGEQKRSEKTENRDGEGRKGGSG